MTDQEMVAVRDKVIEELQKSKNLTNVSVLDKPGYYIIAFTYDEKDFFLDLNGI